MKENQQVQAIRTIGNLICTTGRENGYRRAFLEGRGGSRKEETWSREQHKHVCCQSKVPWCHKISCPRLKEGATVGTAISKNKELVDTLKAEGLTSGQIAARLNLPLKEINELW